MLKEMLHKVFIETTISELRIMNEEPFGPNLSYNSMLYLDIISYKENCTASYIADVLHISKPAVTSKVQDLIRQGLIEKIQSQEDKRIFYLRTTKEASVVYRRYDTTIEHAVEKVEQQFSKDEIAVFCKILAAYKKEYTEGLL